MRTSLLRARRRNVMRFMLMPLVDVIFLLLTFFMLSSNLAGYSALTLGDYAHEEQPDGASPPSVSPSPVGLVVTVAAGEVRANGVALPLADFADEAAKFKSAGSDSAVVFLRPSATTQDIVSVLAALKRAAFASVSVRGAGDRG